LKVSVIAPLGYSPPVITEFIQYLLEGMEIKVTDLNLLVTKETGVIQGAELVKTALAHRYPKIHIHIHHLPFADIGSTSDSLTFMKVAAGIIREAKERYRADGVYLCVAGGRKDMCIILSLVGQFLYVNGVYHVIMEDVKVVNTRLALLQHEIEELAKAEDKMGYYEAHRQEFDELMFPPPSQYTVIRIPVVPYPIETLRSVVELLKDGKKPRRGVRLPWELLARLEAAGLLKIRRIYIYPTHEGREIASAIEVGLGGR
jgi:CRISPR-associated protein Csx14